MFFNVSFIMPYTFTFLFQVQCWYCQPFYSKVKFGILMQTFSFRVIHCHWNLILLPLKVSVIKCLFCCFLLRCLVHQYVHVDICTSLL